MVVLRVANSSEERFISLTQWMDWNFADNGVEFDGIYYCPHHAEHGMGNTKKIVIAANLSRACFSLGA